MHGMASNKTRGDNRRMILDATAGNRTMYETKNAHNIIYIDIQKKLYRKPTIYADCTRTPFRDKTFHTIFFDPPHDWGKTAGDYYTIPDLTPKEMSMMGMKGNTYYGHEIYQSRMELTAFIYKAQKEFLRILKDDGLLWLKWNDYKIPLSNILAIFKNWRILMILRVNDPTQTIGTHQTYWICLCKKEGYQTELSAFQS